MTATPSSAHEPTPLAAARSNGRRARALHLLPLAALLGLAALVYLTGWYRAVPLETVLRHRAVLGAFVADHAVAALALYVALYAGTVALSIPGAAVLTIAGGALFGAVLGGAASVLGATLGATVIFLVARSAWGAFVQRRAGPRAEKLAASFRRHGFWYLLFLRLVPLFPFCLVNIAPALARLRLAPFLGATVLGIIPASFVFAVFGAGLDEAVTGKALDPAALLTPKLLAALIGLGLLALLPVLLRRVWGQDLSAERCV